MTIAAIAFSETGMALGQRLMENVPDMTLHRCGHGELASWTADNFTRNDALLFIGSVGIAVRAIAPHVVSKTSDPAVVVMDELGTYAIPVLSGHLGGANALAVQLSRACGALAVVTTATDIHGLFAVDDWARRQGLRVANPERIKWISARLLSGETIRYKSLYPISGPVPAHLESADEEYDVLISHRSRGRDTALRLVPPIVTLGIGCRKNISRQAVEAAIDNALRRAGCHPAAVSAVATIDLKAHEGALVRYCKDKGIPLVTYSAEALSQVPGVFSSSAFVQKITGVDNVCERAAVRHSGGRLIRPKEAMDGVTVALALSEPHLSFQEAL